MTDASAIQYREAEQPKAASRWMETSELESSMSTTTSTTNAKRGQVTGNPLIESDRVEGTTIYDMNGTSVGSVKRLMIDKLSGKVAYTVASFGGFLGIGTDEYTIPWNKLTYDPSLGGFRTDINAEQLKGSPTFYRENNYSWSDRQRERDLF